MGGWVGGGGGGGGGVAYYTPLLCRPYNGVVWCGLVEACYSFSCLDIAIECVVHMAVMG